MMHATQLEQDFVAWLAELSAGVEIKSQHWLETEDGDANGGDFCGECAEIQRRINKREKGIKKADRFIHVKSDGGSAMESDSYRFCERCGAVLACSPSRYAIEEEIRWLEDATEMDATSALTFCDWLTGMGDYQREIDWPLIEPHARRLMEAAGVEVVQPGFVRFRPSQVLLSDGYDYYDEVLILAYEHYAAAYIDSLGANTTSINRDFSISDRRGFLDWLAELFRQVGRSEFLDSIGIRTWADLDRPILLPDHRPNGHVLEQYLNVGGRVLRKPGPNEFHSSAIHVHRAKLHFNVYDLRWAYVVTYGDLHDSSSWAISLEQVEGQTLPEFFAAIGLYIEQVMDDEDRPDIRMHRWKQWHELSAAVQKVFYFSELKSEIDDYQIDDKVVDELMGIERFSNGEHRMDLDARRLKVLRGWIAKDTEKYTKERG